jgi:hypothetical protein
VAEMSDRSAAELPVPHLRSPQHCRWAASRASGRKAPRR